MMSTIVILSIMTIVLAIVAVHYYFKYDELKIINGTSRESRNLAHETLSRRNGDYLRLLESESRLREKMANEALDDILRDKPSEQETKTVSKFMVN